ncbi:hypothetical protein Sjap_003319 [Stephania japonica]|uniref:Uncharacterized protein n=1 Tax=Stephania japonica TaxID=461633 RepID=A0AAP0KQ92_9MAGN
MWTALPSRQGLDWSTIGANPPSLMYHVEKSTARTEEEKKIAKEKRKAKEHGAKTELHATKVAHNHMVKRMPREPNRGPMVGTHGAPVGAAYGHHYGPLLGTHGAMLFCTTTRRLNNLFDHAASTAEKYCNENYIDK